ncbi:hypothetical protein BBJ28_00008779 [Nothophytophthora sp. Chile5]|nr:hypothetical protein BBJ28_00008779 [Nothophytophthora sp. Chile5]
MSDQALNPSAAAAAFAERNISPTPPARVLSDSFATTPQRRHSRPGSARQAATTHSVFHNLLAARKRRRTFSGTSGEFHDLIHQESSTAKSVEAFRGEAKGILHGIFFVLLLRFLLALVVAVGALGMAAVLILMIKEPDTSFTRYLLFYS